MQDAQNAAGAAESGGELPGSRVSVGTIALAVLVLAGIVSGVIILTRDSGAPEAPPAGNGGAFRLSDEEAIDRYLELDALVARAYKTNDPSLIPHIYTVNSPTADVVLEELRRLNRRDLLLQRNFTTEELTVTSNSMEAITLRQVVIARAKLVHQDGSPEPADERPHKRTVEVTLREESGEWLIHRSVVVAVDPLEGNR